MTMNLERNILCIKTMKNILMKMIWDHEEAQWWLSSYRSGMMTGDSITQLGSLNNGVDSIPK